jgi:hypothetical protein
MVSVLEEQPSPGRGIIKIRKAYILVGGSEKIQTTVQKIRKESFYPELILTCFII